MSGLYLPHVRDLWVRPALASLPPALNNLSRMQGVLGIGNKESGYRYLVQTNPAETAKGFWQMETATHDDMWRNFIRYRPDLQAALLGILSGAKPEAARLVDRPIYAAAMCAVHTYRSSDALPAVNDAAGWAAFWKRNYNTEGGAGIAAEAVPYFREAMEA
ncbi:hypothetical protein [Acetobacter cerevisiae]|uniref:Uncharacterized protein n=1 Tax=Acetobacter cerevisiae TaxID=178900 RepID=A0A149Q7J0_9PROT|nr:hypothetical protein [Acetobacter cerevisiae]KXU93299.1 hypothetical protein AD928_08970 [Acetobacter cerevisiae]GBQ10313.1 hypothetical protein AA14362_2511 [Acetobacter cerevisiae DSM 14362]